MHLTNDFLYLPDQVLESMDIAPSAIADAIEGAIMQKAAGTLHTSPKSAIQPGGGRYMMSTLAVGDDDGLTVLKTVMVSPDNPSLNLPAINGAIMALDAQTGLLRAVVGANWITAVRTAGLSAVAARRLADPKSSIVAFVGTGVQAHSHLVAFADMFPLREVRVVGRGQENAEKLCKTSRDMGLKADIANSPKEALSGADLVVTSVTLDYTIEPFLDARWLKPGAFATITDLGIPWHQTSMSTFGPVVIDDRDQENISAKKMVPPELVRADLTELVSGSVPIAHDPARPNCFAFRGMALGDYAATALVVRRAEAQGLGQRISPELSS